MIDLKHADPFVIEAIEAARAREEAARARTRAARAQAEAARRQPERRVAEAKPERLRGQRSCKPPLHSVDATPMERRGEPPEIAPDEWRLSHSLARLYDLRVAQIWPDRASLASAYYRRDCTINEAFCNALAALQSTLRRRCEAFGVVIPLRDEGGAYPRPYRLKDGQA